ncbi:MAG: hypothetical protein IPL59_18855 [Candidatus Competibacteraceae bacterium]|nr:hypothetical protein [Candidatus Competibacteraceae bacterium]
MDRCYEGSFGQQGDLPVAGRFGQNVSTYTVTATAGANGSITPASRTVSKGATATFTVTPNSGYTASVSGCGGTLSGTTYTTGAITVACPVIATFNQNVSTYALTVSKAGTGSGTVTGTGINCGSDCTESYASGTSVILTATADTGSTFAGWNGACSGTGNCMLTMSAVKSAAATFNTTTQNCDVEPCYYITQTGDTEVPVIFRSAISDAYLALQFDERNQNYNGAVFYSESVERISLSFDPKSGMLYNLNIGDEYFLFSNYTQSTVDVIKADVNGVSIAVNIPVPTHLLSFERLEMSTIRPFAGSNDEKTAEWVRKGRDLAIDALEKISKNGNYTVRDAAIDALKEFADTFPYEVTGVSKENADRVRKIISLIGSISTRAACTIGLNPWSCMSYLLNKSDIDRTIDAFTD